MSPGSTSFTRKLRDLAWRDGPHDEPKAAPAPAAAKPAADPNAVRELYVDDKSI